MKKVILAILFMSFCTFFGQKKSNFDVKSSLFYDVGAKTLSTDQKKELDDFINSLNNYKEAYKVLVIGFTDTLGNKEVNKRLSQERALTVKSYLVSKGFKDEQVFYKGVGELKGRNSSENRRVDVNVRLNVKPLKSLGLYKPKIETNYVNNNSGGTVTTESGTKITIPKDAFVNKDGSVVRGKVKIKYREYRKSLDFVLSDIPMSLDHGENAQHFNSAGMFKVNGFSSSGKEVFLKKGKVLDIGFTPTKDVDDWGFYSLSTSEGHAQWKTIHEPSEVSTTQNSVNGVQMAVPVEATDLVDENHVLNSKEVPCGNDKCVDRDFLIKKGEQYTAINYENVSPYYDLLGEIKAMYEVVDTETEMIGMYQERLEDLENEYALKLNNLRSNMTKKIYFHLSGSNSKDRDDFIPFKKKVFVNKSAKDVKLIKKLEKNGFVNGSIEQLSRWDYVLSGEYETRGKTRAFKLNMKPSKGLGSMKQKIANSESIRQKVETLKVQEQTKIDSINTDLKLLYSEINVLSDSAYLMENERPDNQITKLNCFWILNGPYMGKKEATLKTSNWFQFLYVNKDKVAERYDSLKINDISATDCVKDFNERMATQVKTEQAFASSNTFNLPQTGVYNCDQIYRLSNQTNYMVNYQDENGIPVKVYIAYLIDENINGAIRYDGYGGYSSRNFVANSKSNSSLILIDSIGRAYSVKSDQFKKASIEALRKKTEKCTFTIKLIKDDTPESDII